LTYSGLHSVISRKMEPLLWEPQIPHSVLCFQRIN
jgi:hypothetical protein